jgi:CDP-diacylglycerol--serine O-phosphatidyltransferase
MIRSEPSTIHRQPSKILIRQLPNLLTLCNLFCGCCAVMCVFNGQIVSAAWFLGGSFLFDYADGMAARALHVTSPLGKELDSLADMVSFGFVPGALMYMMIASDKWGTTYHSAGFAWASFPHTISLEALPAFILTMFSGLRLGKFNLDTRQGSYFIGLSTPACTVLVLGLALGIVHNRFGMETWLLHGSPFVFYALTALLSWLLISEIPMFGMKIRQVDWRSNALNLGFLGLFLIMLFTIQELALPAIIVIYIAVSVLMKDKITGTGN